MNRNFYISINITNQCNFNCEYCISNVPHQITLNYISITAIRYIVEMINMYLQNSNIHVIVTGGEPLLHPKLNDIISELYKIRNLQIIYIYTNGSYDIQNTIIYYNKIYFILSFHIDIITRNNKLTYAYSSFTQNLKFLNINNIKYHFVVMTKDKNITDKIKLEYIDNVTKLNKGNRTVEYSNFYKTNSYTDNNLKINNNKRNKLVYPYNAISITRNIRANTITYEFCYMCNIHQLYLYKSIYSPIEWAKLEEKILEVQYCKKEICWCNNFCSITGDIWD